MHRVRLGSLARRHIEEAWVKETRLVDEVTVRCMACITDLSCGVVMGVDVKSIFWYLGTDECHLKNKRSAFGYSYPSVNIQSSF